eukprot:gene11129-13152_t
METQAQEQQSPGLHSFALEFGVQLLALTIKNFRVLFRRRLSSAVLTFFSVFTVILLQVLKTQTTTKHHSAQTDESHPAVLLKASKCASFQLNYDDHVTSEDGKCITLVYSPSHSPKVENVMKYFLRQNPGLKLGEDVVGLASARHVANYIANNPGVVIQHTLTHSALRYRPATSRYVKS